MPIQISKADVWAAEIQDQPGGLAERLDAVAGAGASLEFVIARRQPEKPGTCVVFITPIKGKKVQQAARDAGFSPADVATLRVEGVDKPGLGARLCQAVADAGVNTRGVSAAVIGNKYVVYFGFDSQDEAARAAKAMKSVNGARKRK
jgi:hypothetical protein